MSMLKLAFSSIILLILTRQGTCQSCATTFINPPPANGVGNLDPDSNMRVVIGTSFNVLWASSCNGPFDLVLFQDIKDAAFLYLPNSGHTAAQSYFWSPISVDGKNAAPNADITRREVFFFRLFISGGTGPVATSGYLNLTRAVSSSSSAAAILSTSSATISLASSATSRSPSTTGSSDAGLSTGAKAGIGVGIALGAIIVLLACCIIYLLRRKTNASQSVTYRTEDTDAIDAQRHSNAHAMKTTSQIEIPSYAYDNESGPSRGMSELEGEQQKHAHSVHHELAGSSHQDSVREGAA